MSDPSLGLNEQELLLAEKSTRLSILANAVLYPGWGFLTGALGPPLSPPIHDPPPGGTGGCVDG
jgi:hypothetical protein